MTGVTTPSVGPSNVCFDPATGTFKYWDGSAWSTALNVGAFAGQELSVGQATIPRTIATATTTLSTGTLRLAYTTARKTEPWNNIKTLAVTTAAGATPTLCRMGIWSVAANGDLTLIASCANDTTLWATATANGTAYTRALDVPVNAVVGTRYAFGALCVTGAAAPTILSTAATLPITEGATAPRINGVLTSQTDLPATIAAGIIGATNVMPYIVATP